jgi:hypothetical protein
MKMEQIRQQIREMLATHGPYAKMESLWTHLQAKMEENIKARHKKLDVNDTKIKAD